MDLLNFSVSSKILLKNNKLTPGLKLFVSLKIPKRISNSNFLFLFQALIKSFKSEGIYILYLYFLFILI